jgi:hypothetical protein
LEHASPSDLFLGTECCGKGSSDWYWASSYCPIDDVKDRLLAQKTFQQIFDKTRGPKDIKDCFYMPDQR